MDEKSLLKRIPKEHFTLHNGKMIRVSDLLENIEREEEASLKGFKPLSPSDKGRPKQV